MSNNEISQEIAGITAQLEQTPKFFAEAYNYAKENPFKVAAGAAVLGAAIYFGRDEIASALTSSSKGIADKGVTEATGAAYGIEQPSRTVYGINERDIYGKIMMYDQFPHNFAVEARPIPFNSAVLERGKSELWFLNPDLVPKFVASHDLPAAHSGLAETLRLAEGPKETSIEEVTRLLKRFSVSKAGDL